MRVRFYRYGEIDTLCNESNFNMKLISILIKFNLIRMKAFEKKNTISLC